MSPQWIKSIKIGLSVLFVLTISFFVVKGCVLNKPAHHREETRKPLVAKKAVHKKAAQTAVAPPSQETPKGPRMAIILDDWGNNYSLINTAIELQRPITLSILPHLPQSEKIAEEAFKNNLGVMLHVPMQPKNRIKGLEPHTILVTTSDQDIIAYLDSALESVPHVDGVNNHMGSAATSDLRVMKTVLSHLLSKDLFFIDSNTASTSVASQVAGELGIKFTKRDVFIDNDPNPEMIKKQLRRAKMIALKYNRVVVIGHDKKATLLTIKEIAPEIEQAGVKLVLVKDLVE